MYKNFDGLTIFK